MAMSKKSVLLTVLALGGGGMLAVGASAEDAARVDREAGREVFQATSCSVCHTLADAGAEGSLGPTLDNPALTRDLVIDRIAKGQGAMPAFGSQLSEEKIALLADYIVEVNKDAAP